MKAKYCSHRHCAVASAVPFKTAIAPTQCQSTHRSIHHTANTAINNSPRHVCIALSRGQRLSTVPPRQHNADPYSTSTHHTTIPAANNILHHSGVLIARQSVGGGPRVCRTLVYDVQPGLKLKLQQPAGNMRSNYNTGSWVIAVFGLIFPQLFAQKPTDETSDGYALVRITSRRL